MEHSNNEVIKIGDKSYLIKELPSEIQGKINVYNKWEEELAEARIQVVKLEMAINVISNEVVHDIKSSERKNVDEPTHHLNSAGSAQQELDLS